MKIDLISTPQITIKRISTFEYSRSPNLVNITHEDVELQFFHLTPINSIPITRTLKRLGSVWQRQSKNDISGSGITIVHKFYKQLLGWVDHVG